MGWVTPDDGQHIWIGPKGNVEPRGPGSKSEAAVARARKGAAKTAALAKSVQKPAASPGSKASAEILQDRGHRAGYKDVSNFVAGPAHTRHAIHERLARWNRGIDAGSPMNSPWWQGYRSGARRATDDWLNHFSKATGGRQMRTVRRLLHLQDKI